MANGHFLRHLEELQLRAEQKGSLTLNEVIEVLGEDAHLLLMLFLSLPFTQPLPLPGFSTPLGLMLAGLAVLHYRKKKAWLPRAFCDREISQKTLLSMVRSFYKVWAWLEKWFHPRWQILVSGPVFRFVNHSLIVLHALLLALPLPIPFSNNLPALSILCLLLAYVEEDGLMVLFSHIFSLLTIAFFSGIVATLTLSFTSFFNQAG